MEFFNLEVFVNNDNFKSVKKLDNRDGFLLTDLEGNEIKLQLVIKHYKVVCDIVINNYLWFSSIKMNDVNIENFEKLNKEAFSELDTIYSDRTDDNKHIWNRILEGGNNE